MLVELNDTCFEKMFLFNLRLPQSIKLLLHQGWRHSQMCSWSISHLFIEVLQNKKRMRYDYISDPTLVLWTKWHHSLSVVASICCLKINVDSNNDSVRLGDMHALICTPSLQTNVDSCSNNDGREIRNPNLLIWVRRAAVAPYPLGYTMGMIHCVPKNKSIREIGGAER